MENPNVNIRFDKINVLQFSQYTLEHGFDKEKYPLIEFQTSLNLRVMSESKQLACLVVVRLIVIETGEKFAELQVENIFDVDPFDVIKKEGENNFNIPNMLINNILSISVSTIRGTINEKLKGTIAQNDIFPLMDISQFFKEPQKK